jgi:hypothetical protein
MRVAQRATVASGCGIEHVRLTERCEPKRTHSTCTEVQKLAPVKQMIRIE